MKSSIKKYGPGRNLTYSAVLMFGTNVFPLIVYPYVSRVLGVANIGLVGFIDSIITYFILFSMMGISVLGVREMSLHGKDPNKRGNIFRSLLTIQSIFTAVALVILVALTFFIDELRINSRMMVVGMGKLVFNLFIIEWYYIGIGRLGFITVYSIVVRAGYAACVFLFVKNAGDTLIYYFLTMTVVLAMGVGYVFHARKEISLCGKRPYVYMYLKPFLALGIYILLQSVYTTLNATYLGFATDDVEVGFYATASKLFGIFFGIYFFFLQVMMPGMTSLVSDGNYPELKRTVVKNIRIIILLGVPVLGLCEFLAPQIVELISGPGYEGAIMPMRILFPLIIVSGIEKIVVVHILMPIGSERTITRISAVACAVAVILNILLVGKFGAVGSAVVWLACEIVVLVLSIVGGFRKMRCQDNKKMERTLS